MPDSHDDTNLARRIEELESLLAEQRVQAGSDEAQSQHGQTIPILDDIVNPEDYDGSDAVPSVPADEKITELAERLEEKFSMELDETVDILKTHLRESILSELHALSQQDSDDHPEIPPGKNPEE